MTAEDGIQVVVEVYYAGLMNCRSYPMPISAAKDFLGKIERAADREQERKHGT